MKYMALLFGAEDQGPEPGSPEWGPYMARWEAYHEKLAKGGIEFSGEALQPSMTATKLKVRGGKTETMDGPFAETKEQLGGFYILDCKDLDEALKWAALCPAAEDGTVEVRPVMDLGEV